MTAARGTRSPVCTGPSTWPTTAGRRFPRACSARPPGPAHWKAPGSPPGWRRSWWPAWSWPSGATAAGPGRPGAAGRAGLAAWLTALTTLTGLAGLNAYVGYIPTLAYIYLPPGYDDPATASRRYPVVYLLHGYPGGPLDWFRAVPTQQLMDAMLADHLIQPMIVVAPNANGGWLHDSEMLNQVDGPQTETYLTRAVVGWVDARFRTVAARAGRAIGGMSSGGYGALNLGLRDHDVYSVILSEMPYGDPGQAALGLLGGSQARWAANAPDRYIPTMTFRHRMAVDLLVGPDDSQHREAALLARMVRARGQPTAYTLVPGAGHTWRSAGRRLPYALRFASQHLHAQQLGPLPLANVPHPGHRS
jgi:enterochelin esterase-like enzyme